MARPHIREGEGAALNRRLSRPEPCPCRVAARPPRYAQGVYFIKILPCLVTRTACPLPVIPGLSAGTRGVSASAAVAPPPRVSTADHDRVADLVRKGNRKHVLAARVRAAPRVVVAARPRVRVWVGRAVDDADVVPKAPRVSMPRYARSRARPRSRARRIVDRSRYERPKRDNFFTMTLKLVLSDRRPSAVCSGHGQPGTGGQAAPFTERKVKCYSNTR